MRSLFIRYIALGFAGLFIMVNSDAVQAAQWSAQPGSVWLNDGNEIVVAKSWKKVIKDAAKKAGKTVVAPSNALKNLVERKASVKLKNQPAPPKIREKKKF